MADKSLVKGAAVLGATTGFTDYSKQFKGSDAATQARLGLAVKQKQEAEVARVTGEINSYMGQLKSDISFRDLDAGSQNTMKSWLGSKRNEYAYAANQISKIQDASSPEYQQYADIMNQINNDISNLSDQVKSYKENKLAFVDMNEKDMWSAGNNPESNQQAQLIYGLGDFTPPMQINSNGDLAFNVNGNNIRFNDYKSPFLKDYKAATYITTQANTIYNSGVKLNDAKRNTIRLGLEQQLADPNSLRSVISNDFTVDGLDFSNIVFNPEDIAGTRKQVIDTILNGFDSVANAGYSEKQNKGKNSSVNPGNVVKNADGTQTYVSPNKTGPLVGDVDSYTDTKQGDYAMRIDQATDYAINDMQEITETIKGSDGKEVEQTVMRGVGMPFKIKGMEFTPVYQAFEIQGKGGTNKTKAVYIYQQGGKTKQLTYDQMMQYAKGA